MLNTLDINLKTDIKTDRPTTLPITLMSQDKNNNQFILRFTNGGEPVNLDNTYTVEVLTKFSKSGTSRLTTAKVRQDYATWEFDTSYITQDETVYNYVYVRKSGNLVVSADANCFVFSVDLSEIDKGAGKVAETYDENYQKHLDEFKENVNFEEIAQAEQARKEAEILREENYEQKVDTAIVEADVVEKVDNKVTELTPQISNLTAQLAQNTKELLAPKVVVDSSDDGLVYVGNWEVRYDAYFLNGSLSRGANPAYIEYQFDGTGVGIFCTTNVYGGLVEIIIDGVTKGVYDTYSSTQAHQVCVFETNNLPLGHHVVKLLAKGQGLGGVWVQFDCLEVYASNRINSNLTTLESIRDYHTNATAPLAIPTYDGSYQVVHPKVLYFPNKWRGFKYWMAMTPYTDTNDKTENPSVVVSEDGYTWVERKGLVNPISGIPNPDGHGHYSDTHLVYHSQTNKLEVWYRYNPPNANDTANDNATNYLYRQTSSDGVAWSEKEIIFESLNDVDKPYVSPSIIFEDSKYRMWYHDYNGRTFYRESADAVNWTSEQTVTIPLPQNVIVWHSDIIHEDGLYEAVLSCQMVSGNYELFYSTSTDGISFTEAEKIIKPTYGTDRLDNLQIYRSSILKVNGLYKIYYSARDTENRWHTFLTEGYGVKELQGYNGHEFRDKVLFNNLQIIKGGLKLGEAILSHYQDRVSVTSVNDVEIATSTGNGLVVTKTGEKSAFIDFDGLHFQHDRNGSYYKTGIAKFQKDGVGAVIVKYDQKPNTLSIRNQSDTAPGFLEAGAVHFTGSYGGMVQTEGAMRYNPTKKKLEFYNGAAWETVQSS